MSFSGIQRTFAVIKCGNAHEHNHFGQGNLAAILNLNTHKCLLCVRRLMRFGPFAHYFEFSNKPTRNVTAAHTVKWPNQAANVRPLGESRERRRRNTPLATVIGLHCDETLMCVAIFLFSHSRAVCVVWWCVPTAFRFGRSK